jgi:hypothetical protein
MLDCVSVCSHSGALASGFAARVFAFLFLTSFKGKNREGAPGALLTALRLVVNSRSTNNELTPIDQLTARNQKAVVPDENNRGRPSLERLGRLEIFRDVLIIFRPTIGRPAARRHGVRIRCHHDASKPLTALSIGIGLAVFSWESDVVR